MSFLKLEIEHINKHNLQLVSKIDNVMNSEKDSWLELYDKIVNPNLQKDINTTFWCAFGIIGFDRTKKYYAISCLDVYRHLHIIYIDIDAIMCFDNIFDRDWAYVLHHNIKYPGICGVFLCHNDKDRKLCLSNMLFFDLSKRKWYSLLSFNELEN